MKQPTQADASEQEGIREWFDETYRQRGFDYLRPRRAYRVYVEVLGLEEDAQFLDVACGPGLMLSQAVAAGCQAHGVDLSAEAIQLATELVPEAQVYVANAETLPFADRTMDFVSCLGSLERMIDLPRVLAEIRRVSSDTARIVFLVRNENTLTWRWTKLLHKENRKGHQGADSLATWQATFEQAGFLIEDVLPDQWPGQRLRELAGLGLLSTDLSKVRKGVLPLTLANEFLFVLRPYSDALLFEGS